MRLDVFRCLVPVAIMLCSLGQFAPPSHAAEFRMDDRAVVEAGEVVEDDLYIFGEEVTIDGEVKGDVIAAGRIIRINGVVDGDLAAAAQAIVISGTVTDDVRMAGQVLKIDKGAAVADDVLAAAFSLEALAESSVGGDWFYGGYQALLAGDLAGDLNGGMANCEIRGKIGGDVQLSVDGDPAGAQAYTAGSPPPISPPSVPAGLTIGDSAQIEGKLSYLSPDEADIADGAQIIGEIRHERPAVRVTRPPTPAEKALKVVRKYAALLVLGLALVLLAPGWARRISDQMQRRPLASLGLGVGGIVGFVVLLIGIPVGMLILAILAGAVQLTGLVPVVIVLGLSSAAMLIVGFWFFVSYLAEILVSFFAGRWLLGRASASLGENRFLSLILGLVLMALITSVPYLGNVVGWLVALLALGALVLWMFWKSPAAAAPAAADKPQAAAPSAE